MRGGLDLQIARAAGKARIGEVAAGVRRFIAMMLAIVFAIYFVPDIALYIPFRM